MATQYRIIEVTKKDGTVKYHVERKKKKTWYRKNPQWELGYDQFDGHWVYNNLDAAKRKCGINPNPVVKRRKLVGCDTEGKPFFVELGKLDTCLDSFTNFSKND